MDTIKTTVIKALEQYKGIVTTACKSVDLPRSTFYKWYNEDAEFKAAVDDVNEIAIDFVESKLIEKINGITMMGKGGSDEEDPTYQLPPSDTAIIFYLKTKGKKRGYVERTESEVKVITEQPMLGDDESQ